MEGTWVQQQDRLPGGLHRGNLCGLPHQGRSPDSKIVSFAFLHFLTLHSFIFSFNVFVYALRGTILVFSKDREHIYLFPSP